MISDIAQLARKQKPYDNLLPKANRAARHVHCPPAEQSVILLLWNHPRILITGQPLKPKHQFMNKSTWYKGYSILFESREVLQYAVCFDKHECDYGDYPTLAIAKKAIDRFLKACGE